MYSTMADVPLSIGAILQHAGQVYADRAVATGTGAGHRTITYRELTGQAGQLANCLRRLGITGDQRVATFLWNNTEHLTAYLAIPAMGAVLHTVNIRLFAEQISYIVNEAQDQIILADLSVAGLLAPVLPELDTVHTVIAVGVGDTAALEGCGKTVLRYRDVVGAESVEFDWPSIEEHQAASICYTSGTTGNPKGVVYSHRSTFLHAMSTCTANGAGIGAADRVLPIVPMFHANAWGLPYAALMAGADLVLPDRYLDPGSLITLVETLRPTVAGAVPTIWNDLLHFLDGAPGRDVSSLRLALSGGSAVPVPLMRAFQQRHGVRIVQAWGMTETSPLATMAWPPAGICDDDQWDYRGTQGRPLCGVQTRIVDDAGRVLPNDGATIGELEVRGPWVTGSYYRGRDAARFTSGWLRTGDIGRIDRYGFITLTDRSKDVIKSGGEWISSVALESELLAHPGVVEAAVVAVPDERWQERPLAVVVARNGVAVTAAVLREFLAGKVVRWWLPERWTFVDAIPRTSVGKYDKKTIRSRYADGGYRVIEMED